MTELHPDAARIRPARPEDLEALVVTQRTAELAALAHVFPPDRYPFPTRAVTDRWRTALAAEETSVLLAERGGRAVGLACVAAGWLRGLFVAPEPLRALQSVTSRGGTAERW